MPNNQIAAEDVIEAAQPLLEHVYQLTAGQPDSWELPEEFSALIHAYVAKPELEWFQPRHVAVLLDGVHHAMCNLQALYEIASRRLPTQEEGDDD